MSSTTQTARPRALARTITTLALSTLAAKRPHVARVRIARAEDGTAIVSVGYPEDTATAPVAAQLADLGVLVAHTVDNAFDRTGRPMPETLPVVAVHVFADGPSVPGPALEVFLDLSRWASPHLELCLDGLELSESDLDWATDALAAASLSLSGGGAGE
jgi:hypothetical protein